MLRTLFALACAALVLPRVRAAIRLPKTRTPTSPSVLDVKSSFGPDFKVTTVAPTGIDPRLLAPQSLPPGVKFEPPDCAKFATGLAVPAGAEGQHGRHHGGGAGQSVHRDRGRDVRAGAASPTPARAVRRWRFAGPGARGVVEVAESPTIDGVRTLGTHRVVQTVVNGKPASGELYNYVASFGSFLVIVTANPLVQPNQPVAPVNTQRARDLLTAAVAAVRG